MGAAFPPIDVSLRAVDNAGHIVHVVEIDTAARALVSFGSLYLWSAWRNRREYEQ